MNAVPLKRVWACAPGGIGNFGPGLDVLGCAVAGLRDTVIAQWCTKPGMHVIDAGHPLLPTDATQNTASIAASAALTMATKKNTFLPAAGVELRIQKQLPLSGGQGGSAASAVAGAAAMNALLGNVLTETELLLCALAGEEMVAGRHLDNIAPSLLGGIVLVRSMDPIDVVRVPVPHGLVVVLATPAQQLATVTARGVLPTHIPRATVVHQLAQVAAIVAACHSNDIALLGRAMDDRIAETARITLLPGFQDAKLAALNAGAVGSSISGAGPTAFALTNNASTAERIAKAMHEAYAKCGIESVTRISFIDPQGVKVGVMADESTNTIVEQA